MRAPRRDFTPKGVMEPSSPQEMRRLSRRSFTWAGIAMLSAYSVIHWIFTRRPDGGIPWPLRRGLDANEGVWTDFFSSRRRSPTYDRSKLTAGRENGDEGLGEDFDPTTWKLTVAGSYSENSETSGDDISLTMQQIQALPHVVQTTELFCIEGWSIIQSWKGVRFLDFAAKYPPPNADGSKPDVVRQPEALVPYVAMETPDGGYYVGLDMASALHPQTLLCWEMNGNPLEPEHGAPLRLVIPTKYGVKNIKRIGTITYTAARPKDFWAEQGYDWYAGL